MAAVSNMPNGDSMDARSKFFDSGSYEDGSFPKPYWSSQDVR